MPHTEIYLGGFAFNCVKLQAAIKLKESEQELKHGKLNPYLKGTAVRTAKVWCSEDDGVHCCNSASLLSLFCRDTTAWMHVSA